MTDAIEARVKQIIIGHLNLDPKKVINEAFFVDDLGVDSLDAMDLLLAINDEFELKVNPETMEHIHTVQDMIDLIKQEVSDS